MATQSLFQSADNAKIIARIQTLRPDSKRQWGKMELGQMLAHCQPPLRVALGEEKLKRGLLGLLFGKMAKKKLLASPQFDRGLPTAPSFRIKDAREFTKERDLLVALVRKFPQVGHAGLTKEPHPFFGPLTTEEWEALQWKHLDHHLRQFGA